jgi:multiple sugar transport system substrate-binding protein
MLQGDVSRRQALRCCGLAALNVAGIALLAACGGNAAPSTAGASAASPVGTTANLAATGATTATSAQAAATATGTSKAITSSGPALTASTVGTTRTSVSTATAATTSTVAKAATAGATKGTTLDWVVWGTSDQTTIFKQIVDGYAQDQPNLKVQLQVVPFDQFFDKLQTEIASDTPPDVAMASPIWVPNFVIEKMYQPLDSFMARDHFDSGSYFPIALSAFAIDGKQYALPHLLNPSAVFYNKDLFSQAGLQTPSTTWTWDAYLHAAQELTRQSGGKAVQFGTNQVGSLNPILPFIWMNGGDVFDDDAHPTKSTASNPATIDAIQWMADLLTKYHVAPGPDDLSGSKNPFGDHQLGMEFSGAAAIPALVAQKSLNWDAAHLPAGKKGLVDFLGATCHGVVGTSANVDAAWQLVRFICGPTGVKQLLNNQWGVPAIKQLATSDYVKLPPPPAARSLLIDTIEHARPLPNVPQMLKLYTPVYTKWLGDAVAGKVPVPQACATIDQLVNAELNKK